MQINVTLNEQDVRRLMLAEIQRQTGNNTITEQDVKILVKSKQNFRSEWEPASMDVTFKAEVAKHS